MCVSVPALGQTGEGRPLQGYVFAGYGAVTPEIYTFWQSPTTSGGVGVEYLKKSGVGFSGELEFIRRAGLFPRTSAHPSFNVGYYHRGRDSSRKFVPFVSGGYTAKIFINFGGGIQYWAKERLGLRLELRDHRTLYSDSFDAYEIRLGLAFR